MLNIGYAQEIITPPVGVGLAGYMNQRPNVGMYDDLMVKVVIFDNGKVRCGLAVFDLCDISQELFNALEARIVEKFGRELHNNLIICANHRQRDPRH